MKGIWSEDCSAQRCSINDGDTKVVACSITDRLPESEIGLATARHNGAAVVRRFDELARASLNR